MRPVLIVACSQRKADRPGPAIQVYDGQLFRILRKYRPNVDLFILSAKYGLIHAEESIEPYDLTMKQVGLAIIPTLMQQWDALNLASAKSIYICMGLSYVAVLGEVIATKRNFQTQQVQRIGGNQPIGKMQAALKEFCLNYAGLDENERIKKDNDSKGNR